jgi:hypothetical protein
LISETGTNVEQTGSFRQFIWFVPTANHILNGGVEGSLSQTDEEADHDERVESVRSGEKYGERAPNQFHGRDPYRWADPSDEKTAVSYERGKRGQTMEMMG